MFFFILYMYQNNLCVRGAVKDYDDGAIICNFIRLYCCSYVPTRMRGLRLVNNSIGKLNIFLYGIHYTI